MQDRYLNASEQPKMGVDSSPRHSIASIGLTIAAIAVAFFTVWKLRASGVDFWRWQSLVIVIATGCLAIGFTMLFRRLASQLRFLERSEGALRLAKTEAEEARGLAEETNRQHLEAQRIGKIGHWYTDEASRTTTWSPQMFEIVGLPPKALLSADEARSFIHADDIAAFLDARRQAIITRTTTTVENRWVRPDGETRWVHIELRPKFDADGEYLGLFGTTQDITDRKRAEEALKAVQQQLTDA